MSSFSLEVVYMNTNPPMTQKIDVDYEFLVLEGQPSFQDQLSYTA
jgi:hypothetical protein